MAFASIIMASQELVNEYKSCLQNSSLNGFHGASSYFLRRLYDVDPVYTQSILSKCFGLLSEETKIKVIKMTNESLSPINPSIVCHQELPSEIICLLSQKKILGLIQIVGGSLSLYDLCEELYPQGDEYLNKVIDAFALASYDVEKETAPSYILAVASPKMSVTDGSPTPKPMTESENGKPHLQKWVHLFASEKFTNRKSTNSSRWRIGRPRSARGEDLGNINVTKPINKINVKRPGHSVKPQKAILTPTKRSFDRRQLYQETR